MTTTPFWKKINQTVSGYSQNITEDIVSEILKLSKKELLEGLLSYKPYTKKGYDDWVTNANVSSCMKEFVHELSQEINLDTSIAYSVMCNYLMFEYYGKIKEFWQITRIGTTIHLKESIWNFYTAERMFLLKTLRHIFEFVEKDYEFAQQYKEFLKSIKVEELQDNLLKQFECLITEVKPKSSDDNDKQYENWLCRNCREQTELTMILILTEVHNNFNTKQLTKLIKLLVQNNFGTESSYYEVSKFLHKQDLQELMCSQFGCYFVALRSYWDKDMTDFWSESSTKDLNESFQELYLNRGYTLFMLAWFVLKFKCLPDEGDAEKIVELFNKKPFVLLHNILSNNIFKNCTAGETVLKATHRMLDYFCLMYTDRKVLYQEEGLVFVLAEFLKLPDLTKLCLQRRNGLDSIMEIAIETFPYDFFSFTAIANSLLGLKSEYKNALDLLSFIPSFLSDMTWTTPKEEISVLRESQSAFPNSDLIIFPPDTIVRSYPIFGKNLVQYIGGKYSYFLYLEYLVNLLINNAVSQRHYDEELVKKVVAGYNVIIQGIKNCRDMDLEVVGIKRCVEKLNKVLSHLDGPLLNFDLVKMYFDVQNAWMIHREISLLDICPEIVSKIYFPKLKSEAAGIDVAKLLFNEYIFEDTIFRRLFQEEESKEDHGLLLTYIDILYNIIKVKGKHEFQLSGIAYLLNFVFVQHQIWTYKEENQKAKITLGCLTIFHYILQQNFQDLNQDEQQIFTLCKHVFLNNSYIIESFLRLFVKEKYHLIFLMERESNWSKGPSLDRLQCIRMQLALLLILMKHRKTEGKCNFSDKLPFVVKPVASYFTNSYSPIIAELSCRFLEKLAQDPYVPLLALLELDHYQVQSLFLERLRDPLEEENVKLAIIDLINTCIANQNGMTAAFFNLKCFMYWDGTENDLFTGDSVSDFMVDYLQNIKKSHEYFKNPLQLGILRLLYNLWLNHRENLIDNIANLKDFWPVMLDPFFCDFIQDVEVYTVILRIVNLEMGANIDSVEKKLVNIIDKFLKNKDQLKSWIDFVLAASHNATKDHHELLSAWMEFLVLTKKVVPDSFTDDTKFMIIISCLDGINLPLTSFSNIEIVYLWVQLYLMLVSTWSIYEKNERLVLKRLSNFLHALTAYYKYLSPKIKEVVLCTVNRTIIDLSKFLSVNTTALVSFLNSVSWILDTEYEYLVSEVWTDEDETEKIRLLRPWLIIIFIGNSLMALGNVEEITIWFSYRKFLPRVLDSVGPMLESRAILPFAKLAIDFLITYAESPLAEDFLKCDLYNFYYKIRPPSLAISVGEAILSGLPVNLKEWWLIFITLMKFNRVLLDNLGSKILNTCFAFVSQNDHYLREIICLSKCTVDMTALTLVCETLKLICSVLRIKPHWFVQAKNSFHIIMHGIKTTINAASLSILGYKKINFYDIILGKHLNIIESPPTDLVVSVLNKLIEIVFYGVLCLKRARLDIVSLLTPHPTSHAMSRTLWVELDFSVPRFELPISSDLTYGTLLCLAHFLCKTLNQLSPETPSATPRTRQVSMTDLQDEIKVKSLAEIFEHCAATYEKYIGFMVYIQRCDELPNEKMSSFFHYDMAEFSVSSAAVTQLDYHIVKNGLEALMNFLAGEIHFATKFYRRETLFAYKRELSSEIQFFYEFVRKRTSEQMNSVATTPSTIGPQDENDIVKRYLSAKLNENFDDIADNDFLLVISQWILKFCNLST